MATGFSSPIIETQGGSVNARRGFDSQMSFFKDKPTSGCHLDISLMPKYENNFST